MNSEDQPASHLFTLRLWREVDEDGRIEWRGKLRHIQSGDIRHFRGWSTLVPLLLAMLRAKPAADAKDAPNQKPTP